MATDENGRRSPYLKADLRKEILVALLDNSKGMTCRELSKYLARSDSLINLVLRDLENGGFVFSDQGSGDQRFQYHFLTSPKGVLWAKVKKAEAKLESLDLEKLADAEMNAIKEDFGLFENKRRKRK